MTDIFIIKIREILRMNHIFRIRIYKLSLFLLIASLILVFLPGCSYKTYSGRIENATYSFQYRKDYQVNPPNPLSTSTVITDPLDPEAFISVITHPGKEIETSLGSYRLKQDPESINKFRIVKKDTIEIAGFIAQHIVYSYEGYTTIPIPYGGDFASFEYKENTIEIHVLFPSLIGPWGNGSEAFDLLVTTFKIEE
jgi:hypothetical protein